MQNIDRFKLERFNDDSTYLYLDDVKISGTFPGRMLEAQYEVCNRFLVILELDPEHLIFYLIEKSGVVIEQQIIGHWYFESLFENPIILDQDSLEFSFGTRGKLKVLNFPEYSMLSERDSYLQFEGVVVSA